MMSVAPEKMTKWLEKNPSLFGSLSRYATIPDAPAAGWWGAGPQGTHGAGPVPPI